jgi:hypothetical protein
MEEMVWGMRVLDTITQRDTGPICVVVIPVQQEMRGGCGIKEETEPQVPSEGEVTQG